MPAITLRTLSEQESRWLTTLSAAGLAAFTVDQARALLGDDGDAAPQVLHRLCAKRWLKRLERGKYMVIPLEAGPEGRWAEHEYLVAATLVQPYYLAYTTALAYYGYTERRDSTIWVATPRRKQSVSIDNVTYRFVTLAAHKFFGATTVDLLDQSIQIASREKAIADAFDHPEYTGGVLEGAKGLWFGSDELDLAKVVEAAVCLGNQVAGRRLGFWLERLDLGNMVLWEPLAKYDSHNYALLEPSGPPSGPRDAHWRLIVNIPARQLLEWREH
jgi:predicted transcriptional regulator of viral defense system